MLEVQALTSWDGGTGSRAGEGMVAQGAEQGRGRWHRKRSDGGTGLILKRAETRTLRRAKCTGLKNEDWRE